MLQTQQNLPVVVVDKKSVVSVTVVSEALPFTVFSKAVLACDWVTETAVVSSLAAVSTAVATSEPPFVVSSSATSLVKVINSVELCKASVVSPKPLKVVVSLSLPLLLKVVSTTGVLGVTISKKN